MRGRACVRVGVAGPRAGCYAPSVATLPPPPHPPLPPPHTHTHPAAQVCGNAKGALAAVISVMMFHNPVTPRGAMGFGVALGGLTAYAYLKQVHKTRRKGMVAAGVAEVS